MVSCPLVVRAGKVKGINGMELTEAQCERIAPLLPKQPRERQPAEHPGAQRDPLCGRARLQWRGLPQRFGNWHTIYTRMNRWSKNGVLDRVFEHLQREQIVRIKVEALGLDSTSVKVHPDGAGARKKTVRKPSASPAAAGPPSFIWLPRMPERRLPSAPRPATRTTPPEGRKLLSGMKKPTGDPALVMDRAYEDNATRQLALELGFSPVVPPKSNRLNPWEYDRELYKRLQRSGAPCFRRLKGFRRIFSRFEKLDVIYLGFVTFVLIVEALEVLTRPSVLSRK